MTGPIQICCVYCFDPNNTIMQKNGKMYYTHDFLLQDASPSYRGRYQFMSAKNQKFIINTLEHSCQN